MASSLVDLLAGIATALRADARLTGVNVSVHGGKFTDVELKAYGAKSPHVVLAMLRASIASRGAAPVATVSMVAVVLESDRAGAGGDRHTRALALTDATLRALNRISLTVPDTTFPKDLHADNLFSPAWDRAGLAAWAIPWVMDVKLAEVVTWDSFATLNTQYDITPRDNDAALGDVIEAEDEQTFP